jgi:hypothetical protein
MRLLIATWWFGLALAAPVLVARAHESPSEDEFAVLLERLRKESPGEYEKVVELSRTDRPAAVRFLRERFGPKAGKTNSEKKPDKDTSKPVQGKNKPA